MANDNDKSSNWRDKIALVLAAIAVLTTAGLLRRPAAPTPTTTQQFTADPPTIVLFVLSLSCSHCYQQIELFTDEFTDVPMIVVSPQIDSEIQQRMERDGVEFVRDTDRTWNRRLNIPYENGMHATVILAPDGNKSWQHIDPEPLLDVGIVLEQLARYIQ